MNYLEIFHEAEQHLYTVLLEGDYGTFIDVCVELPIGNKARPGDIMVIWGEENDGDDRLYSVSVYSTDKDGNHDVQLAQMFADSTHRDDLRVAIYRTLDLYKEKFMPEPDLTWEEIIAAMRQIGMEFDAVFDDREAVGEQVQFQDGYFRTLTFQNKDEAQRWVRHYVPELQQVASIPENVLEKAKPMFVLCEEYEDNDAIRSFTILGLSNDEKLLQAMMREKIQKDEYGFVAKNGVDEEELRDNHFITNFCDGFVEYYILEEKVLAREQTRVQEAPSLEDQMKAADALKDVPLGGDEVRDLKER